MNEDKEIVVGEEAGQGLVSEKEHEPSVGGDPQPVEMADSAGVTQPPAPKKRKGAGRKKSTSVDGTGGGGGRTRPAKTARQGTKAMGDLLVPLPDPASLTGDRTAGTANGSVKDLASLRLSQDFALTGGVKKALLTVPVRKPNRQEWVRVHPGEDMRFPAAVIKQKDDNETYIIDAGLRDELEGEWAPVMLYVAVNRQGVVFLWPVRMPGEDGRLDPWNESATEAVSLAMDGWVRVAANRSLGAYEVFQPASTFPEPAWPEKTLGELVTIAFRNRIIDSPDHPILRLIRGEV